MPLYILGSSLFGAELAARLGLPYAFASHFAPRFLHEALKAYRDEFKPSQQLQEPYAIAGVGVIAADTEADELMTVHYSDTVPNRLRSAELLAQALDPVGAA